MPTKRVGVVKLSSEQPETKKFKPLLPHEVKQEPIESVVWNFKATLEKIIWESKSKKPKVKVTIKKEPTVKTE
jgi:hypothetical protein